MCFPSRSAELWTFRARDRRASAEVLGALTKPSSAKIFFSLCSGAFTGPHSTLGFSREPDSWVPQSLGILCKALQGCLIKTHQPLPSLLHTCYPPSRPAKCGCWEFYWPRGSALSCSPAALWIFPGRLLSFQSPECLRILNCSANVGFYSQERF